MKGWFLALVLVVGLIVAAHIGLTLRDATVKLVPPLKVTCQEDMPCWDCETMGNKVCGIPARLG